MYTTCRIYTDARELAELIVSNQTEIEGLLRAVPGFNAYYMVRTDDGLASITICDTKEGAEQSNKVAAEWVRTNGVGLRGTSPKIYAGPTPIALTTGRAAVTA
jgi:hypothetical protein